MPLEDAATVVQKQFVAAADALQQCPQRFNFVRNLNVSSLGKPPHSGQDVGLDLLQLLLERSIS